MKVYKVTIHGKRRIVLTTPEEIPEYVNADLPVGQRVEIAVAEMSQAEYDALPENEGL